jgi:hypothetical protein
VVEGLAGLATDTPPPGGASLYTSAAQPVPSPLMAKRKRRHDGQRCRGLCPYRRRYSGQTGAPQSMKMALFVHCGPMMPQPATRSNRQVSESCTMRRGLRNIAGWSGYPRIAALVSTSGIDVMCQKLPSQ